MSPPQVFKEKIKGGGLNPPTVGSIRPHPGQSLVTRVREWPPKGGAFHPPKNNPPKGEKKKGPSPLKTRRGPKDNKKTLGAPQKFPKGGLMAPFLKVGGAQPK